MIEEKPPIEKTVEPEEKPYISASTSLPELTVKAILLGALLSVILGAANAYFGLFAGMTVSASIPAAVISMAVLKLFRNSNILENNLVQTAASAGESLAAGVIFTIPALVLMGYWQEFNYWETSLIAITGGVLGVMFTIPLRKALIVQEKLKFPEGVATAEVLKTGEEGGKAVKYLIYGGLIGAIFKLSDTGLNLWHNLFEKATLLNNKFYLYFGLNLSPALVAVGYIVGLNIAFLVFFGGVISWYFAIPTYIGLYGPPEGINDPATMGGFLWTTQIRYLGVGAMIVGGLWALVGLRKSLVMALKSGVDAFKEGTKNLQAQARTELDTPMSWVIIGIGAMIVPIFIIYLEQIQQVGITIFMAVVMMIAGFLFSAVAGYMAGLVGSSNNPISGVTIATILSAALMLAALMGTNDPIRGAAGAILVGAVVCCAAAIAGDNLQDLKAGYILGATPWKQQVMQMIGVVAGALFIAPVLNYLLQGYGIGAPTPEMPNALAAPQATLMQSVASGIFVGGLPWGMVSIGAVIAVVIIAMDVYLKNINSTFRMPVLAVAVGIYLPFELDSAIFVGGVIAWLTSRYMRKNKQNTGETHQKAMEAGEKSGVLLASGLITGEALMGIMIAIGIVVSDLDQWRIFEEPPLGSTPGLVLLILITVGLYYTVVNVYKNRIKGK